MDFRLGYEKSKHFDYRKFLDESKYRAVLFRPAPHNTTGKQDFSSVITNMENKEGYPQAICITEDSSGYMKNT